MFVVRWCAVTLAMSCDPIAGFAASRPSPPIAPRHETAPARSFARPDTGEITYQGLRFRPPAGAWRRQESPQSLIFTRDVSPQRVQQIAVWPVPVPDAVRMRTVEQHAAAFFALERERARPPLELWQGFARGVRKAGDREFPVLTFTREQRIPSATPAAGMFALYFPTDFTERHLFYCFVWLDLDLERESPSDDVQPLLSLLASATPPPLHLVEPELAALLALAGPSADAPTLADGLRDAEIGRAAQWTRAAKTYSTLVSVKTTRQPGAQITWRVDVAAPDRIHALQSAENQFDEWISIGGETYRNAGSWVQRRSGEEALNRFFPADKFVRLLSAGAPSSARYAGSGDTRYLIVEYRTSLLADFAFLSPDATGVAEARLWIDPRTHLLVRGDVASRDARGDSLLIRQSFAGYGEPIRIEPPVLVSAEQPSNPDALRSPRYILPASALLGQWEWTRASAGGIGNLLHFASGDQLVLTYAVVLNGMYRTDGDRLIRSQSARQGGVAEAGQDTVYFAVRGDSLLRWWRSRPDTLVATRTSASRARSGLVGQWSYPYAQFAGRPAGSMPGMANAIAFETYTDSGRFHFRIPLRPQLMQYRVSGDTLFIDGAPLPGGRARWQWQISRDTLRITMLDSPGAPPALYARPPQP
jgi:hypothetical protein